ncbi:CoA-transferase family III domain-containing protein [Pterulicium gracile]|uniref:CoA-transferase family III domain-containing protein n=1 Tax=Pterulicium gracile TaxID=1884261 RepID=A0A5C3Q5G1_9AGAR|nr:CoA-transferase family III domain-containing protein [Pterula gracilis]
MYLSGSVTALAARNMRSSFSTSRLLYSSSPDPASLLLSGIKVLELGQLIAGPFAGQLLGHFSAEVMKIEPPNIGDPLRVWRELDVDGTRPVTVDLRKPAGRDIVRKIALKSDVIIENFKPGTLEKWDLGPTALHPHSPGLIFTRVSGYGQTGPWSQRPGYASVCEAESEFRYVNGYPDSTSGGLDGPPVRPNISLGDSVAGLHAAFGTVLALLARGNAKDQGRSGGQVVNVSIVESMLNLMEGVIPEYDRKQKEHTHSPFSRVTIISKSSYPRIVPTNAYPCLATSPSTTTTLLYSHNKESVERADEIEKAISDWTSKRSVEEAFEKCREAGVPVGRVANVRDVVGERHWLEREAVEDVWVGDRDGGWNVKMPGVFSIIRWARPELGAHTEEVLREEVEKMRKVELI